MDEPKPIRRIVFLDIDGVLNSREVFERICTQMPEIRRKGRFEYDVAQLDEVMVGRLNRILERTGAEVVLSSTWRKLHLVHEVQAMLECKGFTGRILSQTPVMNTLRGHEIERWLQKNAPSASYVILDDDSDMEGCLDRLVQTSCRTGLQDEHVERAVALLMESSGVDS
jgi:hypothetical protein